MVNDLKKDASILVLVSSCLALILISSFLVLTSPAFADTCVKDCDFGPDRTCTSDPGGTCETTENGCTFDNGDGTGGGKLCATPI